MQKRKIGFLSYQKIKKEKEKVLYMFMSNSRRVGFSVVARELLILLKKGKVGTLEMKEPRWANGFVQKELTILLKDTGFGVDLNPKERKSTRPRLLRPSTR